jgi:hypothetical protein
VPRDPLPDQILALLGQFPEPRTADSIRSHLRVRNQRLIDALRQLVAQRKIGPLVSRLCLRLSLRPDLPGEIQPYLVGIAPRRARIFCTTEIVAG